MVTRTRPPKPKPKVLEHFTPIKKIGFHDSVRCWCGNERLMGGPDFQAWIREHSECEPPQEQAS